MCKLLCKKLSLFLILPSTDVKLPCIVAWRMVCRPRLVGGWVVSIGWQGPFHLQKASWLTQQEQSCKGHISGSWTAAQQNANRPEPAI